MLEGERGSSLGQDMVLTEVTARLCVCFWMMRFYCYKAGGQQFVAVVVNLRL